jgi:Family of unknown function (DUF6298)
MDDLSWTYAAEASRSQATARGVGPPGRESVRRCNARSAIRNRGIFRIAGSLPFFMLGIVGVQGSDATAVHADATTGRALTGPDAAHGPLAVSKTNPRYFTVVGNTADRRVVYLTGSHVWNNFQDGLGPDASTCGEEANEFSAYLQFLKDHRHNFIRLWRWEHFASATAAADFHLCMSPQPWPRTGPGTASDGKPRFDLSRFDPAYFGRLRDRVIAAGNQGIYVSVMLFDGFCFQYCREPNNLAGHPFYAGNNINGIGITSIVDYEVLPLDPRIHEHQEAYIRKVLDTLHDLPNVLYEVANESSGDPSSPWGDSTSWQYWIINFIHRYESEMGYMKHPVGMSMVVPVSDQSLANEPLLNSPADWIEPSFDDEYFTGRWFTDPPANDGTKVILSDTDHYAAGWGDAVWAWKTFLRGNQPVLMDTGIIDIAHPLDALEPARFAMGDTLRYAQHLDLVDMEPRGKIASTEYALANPGKEYLVLQPNVDAGGFTVDIRQGTYSAEWYSVDRRRAKGGGKVVVAANGPTTFTPPFSQGASVLYLKKTGRKAR